MSEVKGYQIHVGDIVQLKKGDICPCDMLILAASENLNGNFCCQVDSIYDNGSCLRQEKNSVNLTKTFNYWTEDARFIMNFLTKITGRVSFKVNEKKDHIYGTFKLRSDPKVEVFDDTKVIKRGSILKSNYLIGLVLFNSRTSFERTKLNYFGPKLSQIEKKLNNFSIIAITLDIIVAVFSGLLFTRVNRPPLGPLGYSIGFISHLSLHMSLLPLSASVILNLFNCIAAVLLQQKYSSSGPLTSDKSAERIVNDGVEHIPSIKGGSNYGGTDGLYEKKSCFEVYNPYMIPDLGTLDDVFFDKSGTLTTNSYDVKMVSLANKVYFTKSKNFSTNQLQEERAKWCNMQDIEENLNPVEMEEEPIKLPWTNQRPFDNYGEPGENGTNLRMRISKEQFRISSGSSNLFKDKFATPINSPKKVKLDLSGKSPEHENDGEESPLSNRLISTKKKPALNISRHSSRGKEILSGKNSIQKKNNKFRHIKTLGADSIEDEHTFYEDFNYDYKLKKLLTVFSFCHSCKPSLNGFEGSLMEEKALLNLAQEYGIILVEANELRSEENHGLSGGSYVVKVREEESAVLNFYFILKQDRSNNLSQRTREIFNFG